MTRTLGPAGTAAGDLATAARRTSRQRSDDEPAHLEGLLAFSSLVESHLARARRQATTLAVLRLGVDGVLGPGAQPAAPEYAQRVLAECGHRLCSRVRATDQVVRIGADAFGVVLVGANETAARAVSLRLMLAGGGLYRLGDQLFDLLLHAGHAAFPEAGNSAAALVQIASY
jgi:GGDEF domain-containing protein